MEIRLIGDARDATGFALAGVEAVECGTAAEATAALAHHRHDPRVAIIALTEAVAATVPDDIARLRAAVDGPIVVVLPGPPIQRPAERGAA